MFLTRFCVRIESVNTLERAQEKQFKPTKCMRKGPRVIQDVHNGKAVISSFNLLLGVTYFCLGGGGAIILKNLKIFNIIHYLFVNDIFCYADVMSMF